MSANTALVTGGTGFLGKRLVARLLSQGRSVVVMGRTPSVELEKQGVRFVRASLEDSSAVEAACAGVSTVFHVAAKVGVWGKRRDFFRTNVMGTKAIVSGCKRHGVGRLVYTSTPSVVYNGLDLAGADESLPLTSNCPSPYPLTKARAEREVLSANCVELRTVALRPHLIWGVGDPHLVPRVIEGARSGRLRIVGEGTNWVDMVHVENAVDAHIAAEAALGASASPVGGQAYFITNGEPVKLWEWINGLLIALGEKPVTRRISLGKATSIGAVCECLWRILPLKGEPPLTRFVAAELAKDHWFNISAAKRDLGYRPRISMEEGTAELVKHLKEARA